MSVRLLPQGLPTERYVIVFPLDADSNRQFYVNYGVHRWGRQGEEGGALMLRTDVLYVIYHIFHEK